MSHTSNTTQRLHGGLGPATTAQPHHLWEDSCTSQGARYTALTLAAAVLLSRCFYDAMNWLFFFWISLTLDTLGLALMIPSHAFVCASQ